MAADTLLPNLLLAYAIALLLIVILSRLHVPTLVALLIAGALAGPSGLGLIRSSDAVDRLAELGIALLLFTVGLDITPVDAWRSWRRVLVGGALQLLLTTGTVLALATTLGAARPAAGLALGFFVALSSTAIVLKGLATQNALHAPHGRVLVGVLLLQDLAVIAAMLIVPAAGGAPSAGTLAVALGRGAVVLGTVAILARWLVPLVLRDVTGSPRREAFPLAVALASAGTAWMTAQFGLSAALGAFLGGLVLAGSPYAHQAHAEIRPVRDLLSSLFFISIGMLLDLPRVAADWTRVLQVAGAILAGKAGLAALALGLAGFPLRVALVAGLGLAQVGEFSFLFGRAALEAGLLAPTWWHTLLAASLLTMMATPALLAWGPAIGARLATRRGPPAAVEPGETAALRDHVIIVGFGLGGRLVARGLRELGVPYAILDLNGETVLRARADGEPIWYGDAAHPDSLAALGLTRARALVGLLSDPDATLRMVRAVRAAAPALPVVVRTRYRLEAERLERAGATVAVAEEQEASLEVLAQLFARLGVPGNLATPVIELIRHDTTRIRPVQEVRGALAELARRLGRLPVASYQLGEGDWAAGRTIADLHLRAETGASILAVEHDTRLLVSPPPDYRLAAGDIVHLVGEESDLLLATERLKLG